MDYAYSAGAMQALAMRYFDDHTDVQVIDAFADFDFALSWLLAQSPDLHGLLWRWMQGQDEVTLAYHYRLRPRTMARLMDQTFLILSQYLNDERPIVLPNIDVMRDQQAQAPHPIEDLLIAVVSLSMTFSFYS